MNLYLLVLWVEDGIHKRSSGEEVVLQIVGDLNRKPYFFKKICFLSNRKTCLSPVWQPERLHGGVLDVHEGIDPVPDEGLDEGVLGCLEVVVGPELGKGKLK